MADGGILRITRVRLLALDPSKHLQGRRSWPISRRRAMIYVSRSNLHYSQHNAHFSLAIAVACLESDVRQVKALIIGPLVIRA